MSTTEIRIGHLSTFYHTAYILMGTDLLSSEGIKAEWELFASGPDIIKAMTSGKLDVGYIGLPPAIIGIDNNLPIICIAGGHIEGTVMVAGPDIVPLSSFADMLTFLRQFEGKTIGSPPKGSIHDIIIRSLLSQYNLTGISVAHYPWADFLPDAIKRGEIAAAVGTPALAVSARWYGNGRVVVRPEEIWPFNPSYGIVVRKDLLKDPKPLEVFLVAHEKASEMIRHSPHRCSEIIADFTGIVERDFVRETFLLSPHYCSSLPDEYIRSTMEFVRTMHQLDSISRPLREEEIFDTSLIRQVHPGPHHYREGIFNEKEW